ncbi:ComEC/Rec2 family competence protein [Eisenbergiella porci]|uniref:ComEC/Rec2 family competence protein n=1 Tax=Eisenbergiella porci TaxID=2652274 RepID=UPI002A8291D8|nr:MBL fold metallo-hydrolase [Eisenbergiella porci]
MIVKRKAGTGPLKKITSFICIILTVMLITGCANRNGPAEEGGGLPSSCAAADVRETTEASENQMILSFITIGKGDAFLLKLPEDGYYLCDTGKAEDYPIISRLLRQKGVDSLKGIFLSHGHKDHTGSLEAVLADFPTECIYLSAADSVTYESIDVPALAAKYGARLVALSGGEALQLGAAKVQVWIPDKLYKKKDNNNSMVLRFCYGKTAFLMTGDMEKKAEARLLESGWEISADVLKLGHHGKTDSTGKEFLEKVKPQYGIITDSREESPESMNEEIAGRLKECGVQAFYSEGEQLAIDFISDGTSVWTEEVEAAEQ